MKKFMAKNNILVTRMPWEVKGQLFDLQLVSAGNGQMNRKSDLPKEKYGGYNSLKVAYFCVVEHSKGKKTTTEIKPITIVDKKQYWSNPEKYCEDKFGMQHAKIIVKRLLKDSLLEIDGNKQYLSSKYDDKRLTVETAYQLVLDYSKESYIKNIVKHVEMCALKKAELPITPHSKITLAENIELYDCLLQKCNQPAYSILLESLRSHLVEQRSRFTELSLHQQAMVLAELLKAFRNNAENPNLSILGLGTIKAKAISMNIGKCEKVRLINQSVTGLHETCIDLLP